MSDEDANLSLDGPVRKRQDRLGNRPSRTRVIRYIREGIANGTFVPNQRIVEADIARELGVSRTPVREALRELERLGLVRSVPNKGTEIAPIDAVELRETNEVRKVLESFAAGVAAERITQEALRRLEEINELMRAAGLAGRIQKFIDLNYEFHLSLYEVAGNRVLLQVIRGLWDRTTLFRHSIWYLPEMIEVSCSEHGAIIEALRDRDGKRVAQLIREHVKLNPTFR